MTKRILCIVFAAMMAFCLFACENTEKEPGKIFVDTSLKTGAPAVHGDEFTAPAITPASGAPIIGEISKQALPDDSISIAGEGFKSAGLKVHIYGMDASGNAKTVEAKYTVIDDQLMTAIVDSSFGYGVLAVYLENSKGKGNVKYVNLPNIWYSSENRLTAGDTFNIYGENLTNSLKDTLDSVKVYLVKDNKYCQAEVTHADPYKVSIKVPEGLEDNGAYAVKLHNGHGGELGFVTTEQNLIFYAEDPDKYTGKVINVTDYDIDNKTISNEVNHSVGIQAAIDDANDGDIIFFPAGVYFCNSVINVDKTIKFAGVSSDQTFIVTGNQFKGFLFNVESARAEFTNMTFRHVRSSGKIKSGFIKYQGDDIDTGFVTLNVHDCYFLQKIDYSALFNYDPIQIHHATNVTVDNNTFETGGSLTAHSSYKVSFRNNDILSTLYAGSYYGQDTSFFTNVDCLDISGNKFHGSDYLKDNSEELLKGDMTAGRAMVIQGYSAKNYIAYNETRSAGIPGYNAGELVLYENLVAKYELKAESSDGTSVTLPEGTGFSANGGDIITVVKGKGKGQYAYVKGVRKNVITLVDPFDVQLDSTSVILISRLFNDCAVYKNDFHGYSNFDTKGDDATTAIQVYGGMHNLYFTDNIGKYLPEGVCITPYYKGKSKSVVYWSHFDRNTFSDTGIGIRFWANTQAGSGDIAGEYAIGVTMRRNEINKSVKYKSGSNSGGTGIEMGFESAVVNAGLSWGGNWINGAIIEHNTFKDSERADILFGQNSGNTILRGNKGADGKEVSKIGNKSYIEVK